MEDATADPRTPRTAERRWAVLVVVCLATFMSQLDNTVVNVALPSIQRALRLDLAALEWIVGSYILVFAALMIAGGRLADIVGQRTVFLAGLLLFTGASLGAGIAPNGTALLAGRVVQGIGAALLTPATLTILGSTFTDERDRGRAVGAWGGVMAVAIALGPLVGGLISQYLHWGWVFLINVPVGLAAAGLALAVIPADRDTRRVRVLDLPGMLASAAGLFGVAYVLIHGQPDGWGSPRVLGAAALAAVGWALFLLAERRSAEPMIDTSVFRDRVFSGGALAITLWAFGIFGCGLYVSLYLQTVLELGPAEAGLAFLPMAAFMAAGSLVSGGVARRFGVRGTVATGYALVAGGVVALAAQGTHAGLVQLTPAFTLLGVGAGLTMPMHAAVIGAFPASRAGVASAILNAVREGAGLLGVAAMGAVLVFAQERALRGGAPSASAFLTGYRTSLGVVACLVVVGGVVALRTLSPRTQRAAPDPAVRHEQRTSLDEKDVR
ncbi:MFS transporter [Spirillospora sp. CA-255316]